MSFLPFVSFMIFRWMKAGLVEPGAVELRLCGDDAHFVGVKDKGKVTVVPTPRGGVGVGQKSRELF